MRKNTEVYVWVNVHAAMDSGIRFFESGNGVLLCEGFDGLLSPTFFSVVIEVRGGLTLEPPHVRLIERLFAGCSRVTVKKMHGGFSGSLVLRTDSYDADGHAEEPTVTKMDDGAALVREAHETDYIAELAGADAIRVLRGPMYARQSCALPPNAQLVPCSRLASPQKHAACLLQELIGHDHHMSQVRRPKREAHGRV